MKVGSSFRTFNETTHFFVVNIFSLSERQVKLKEK